MTIETEFPGILPADAAAIAKNIQFFENGYDIVVNRIIQARGRKVVLGTKPEVCRFCTRTRPIVTFGKEAHAVPELAGNRTLISLYECDECNNRFSAFEDDLGKLTLLERIAGQVLGKAGVPSGKSGQKKSRIEVDLTGFKIEDHAEDSIVEFDHHNNTMTDTIAPQTFRALGAFKAMVKIAVALMDDQDLARVPEVLRWLRAADLTMDQIDDGTRCTCVRSWTPGPAPFANTRVMLFRRKRPDVPGPFFIFSLAFGNLSFQIVVPDPEEDKHLVGQSISLRAVPIFPLLSSDRVRGPTCYWTQGLSSTTPLKGSASVLFHYDSYTETTPKADSGKQYHGDECARPHNDGGTARVASHAGLRPPNGTKVSFGVTSCDSQSAI